MKCVDLSLFDLKYRIQSGETKFDGISVPDSYPKYRLFATANALTLVLLFTSQVHLSSPVTSWSGCTTSTGILALGTFLPSVAIACGGVVNATPMFSQSIWCLIKLVFNPSLTTMSPCDVSLSNSLLYSS